MSSATAATPLTEPTVDVNVFTTPEGMRNPFPYYEIFRARSPVPGYVDWSPGTVPGIDEPLTAWAVFTYEQVTQVLKNHQVFSSRDPGQERSDAPNIILQGDDPPIHKQRRGLISKAFTPGRIAKLEPWIREQMRSVVAAMGEETTIDVMEDLVGELPTRVMLKLLGLRSVGLKTMLEWAHAFMQSADLAPEERRARNVEMVRVLTAEVDARREELGRAGARSSAGDAPPEDLITALLLAEEDGETLGPKTVVEFLATLIVAGNETSTFLGGHLLHVLASMPEVQRVLRADRARMTDVFDETMRLFGPVHRLFRWVRADTEIGGRRIGKDEWVAVFFVAANRDPAVFPNPDAFDLDRPNKSKNLSFGHGIHFCLGSALAGLNATAMIEALLDAYPVIEPAGEPVMRAVNIFNYSHAKLPIRFGRRGGA